VHEHQAAKWKEDTKMAEYLRPVTLYCASKFEGYLNSPPKEVSRAKMVDHDCDLARLRKQEERRERDHGEETEYDPNETYDELLTRQAAEAKEREARR